MWLRLSAVSHDAQRAVEHLSLVLGLRHPQVDPALAEGVESDLSSISNDQSAWDTYHSNLICPRNRSVANTS